MAVRVRQTGWMDSGDVNEVEISSHEPRRKGSGSTLDQYMPVLLFFALYNLVNIKAAVIASTLWSIKATVSRRRAGLEIGWWLPSVTVYLILRSGVTILVDEEIVDSWDENWMGVSKVSSTKLYCLLDCDKNGNITEIYDKNPDAPLECLENGFNGIAFIKDTDILYFLS